MEARTKPAPWMTEAALEALRDRLGVSWVDLAKRLSVSYQTLLRIRTGRSNGIRIVQDVVFREMKHALLLNEFHEPEPGIIHCLECGGPVEKTSWPFGGGMGFQYFKCLYCETTFRVLVDQSGQGRELPYKFEYGPEVVNG